MGLPEPLHPASDRFFGGADVIVTNVVQPYQRDFIADQPIVLSADGQSGFVPRRRLVVTRHAAELSLLFHEFADRFFREIYETDKYAFFGTLAQAAIDYVDSYGDPDAAQDLLLHVFEAGSHYVLDASAVLDEMGMESE